MPWSLAKIARTLDPPPQKPKYHLALYEEAFRRRKNKFTDILEIGIGAGGSLKLWQMYFPKASIVGMDIFDKSDVVPEGATWHQGNQASVDDLVSLMDRQYDLIIDDGSHVDWDIQFTLGHLFPFVKPAGFYVIEDLDCRRTRNNGSCITSRKILKYLTKRLRFASPAISEAQTDYIMKHILNCRTYRSVSIIQKVS